MEINIRSDTLLSRICVGERVKFHLVDLKKFIKQTENRLNKIVIYYTSFIRHHFVAGAFYCTTSAARSAIKQTSATKWRIKRV
jgi:hypothetical protein